MKFKLYYIGTLLLLACSPTYNLESHEDKVVAIQASADSTSLAIIAPYQKAIEKEMNEILTYTKYNLEKGRPQSTLGNFVTDLCLNYADADICVMNNGGLRTTINTGNITRGKLYELMPFENELVVLEIDENDYAGLLNYICKRGGEPFSGINITMTKEGDVIKYSTPVDFKKGKKIKVLTSDYLANGGDKMSFFQGKEQIKVGIKLRDAIIDYCSKTDTIDAQLDNRIKVMSNE